MNEVLLDLNDDDLAKIENIIYDKIEAHVKKYHDYDSIVPENLMIKTPPHIKEKGKGVKR